ncbi:hypothetical protein [Gemmatimonas sp.]|uniref:hypothetical protein n=1 Tax=Gemmatimonas sp. TaxID=1962908 RepID=UPI0035632D33
MLLAHDAHAQDARTVVLRFRKAGDTVAIRNAQITIDHTIDAGVTDSAGIVRIPDLEDGGHIVEAVAGGYQAFFDKFTSGPCVPMPIDLEILAGSVTAKPKGEPTELRVAGFARRRALGQGKFFTLAQLKAADGRPLANFLKVDAGAIMATGPNGESFLASRAQREAEKGATAPCYAAVVKDGLRIYPFERAAPPDLDKIFTDDLMSIEFYAAAAPVALRDVAKCGVLVLWNRS